jgi:hypothetical protein
MISMMFKVNMHIRGPLHPGTDKSLTSCLAKPVHLVGAKLVFIYKRVNVIFPDPRIAASLFDLSTVYENEKGWR